MRKIVLSIAVAGAALIAASPASAQYYPQPQPYGYNNGYNGYGYNNGLGFNNSWGQVRALQARIDNVERQINRLDRRADRLRDEANRIERRLRDRARNGLDPREAGDIQYRIQRLEQQVQFALNNGYGQRWGDRDDRWGHRDRDDD